MKRPCVYLLASGRNGTLYVGVTSGHQAIFLRREDVIGGFNAEVWRAPTRLVRGIRGHADRHNTRKADQDVEIVHGNCG